jgi:uncharacterized membrane protein YfcA
MSPHVYILTSLLVFFFSGLMAMAGLGAALLLVPIFYYMGVPLGDAVPSALLLNAISLSFASINYVRAGLVDWRIGLPILVTAVVLSPLGARLTPFVNKEMLLALFVAFLLFAGGMMLFYKSKQRDLPADSRATLPLGLGVGAVAGFLGGLLGVGGGNIVVPTLNWLGLNTKVAVGTTAIVVVFSSLSGFLGHISLGTLDPIFIGVMAVMAALGSSVGSFLMMFKVSSNQLKRIIGIALWLIAAKMMFDLMN